MRTWLGMGLLLAGVTLGLDPQLPARPLAGAMQGAPRAPWTSAAIAGLGVVLLLWGRGRDAAKTP